ncbi:hypothetical protein SCHPADRAFT_824811 [Schizopora paradoxa]|uniref:DUF4110 domain-containing protein n=1 Tax=Schizopora paradoxa TaxID=27342 RepID=A0A0H2SE81_9AGAM|nr:hypothetical protein SCHPADRAFT_824811 [Schizopora paradoxa]
MAKKKPADKKGKASAKAVKKAKAAQKDEKKEEKRAGKSKDNEEEEDLEKILEEYRKEWEAKHAVTEEIVEGPPSRRANATLTSCPSGNYLWCIGGEYFSEDGKAYFYNDVYRYNPDKDEWRKFVSPTCPGPRSAHSVAASPAGGGKLFLFGGEFSSLHQNSFHHYRDFWCFDVSSQSWDRIDTKLRPTARSGCRMAMWKHYVILFGGFYDPGIRTHYLNDLWYFDTQEYRWKEVSFKDTERRPSPRSGFSFIPTPEGIIMHGGYCKEYAKGKRPVGVMLEDTWFLRITLTTPPEDAKSKTDLLTFKWEKRKKIGYAPSLRSGCSMALWANKSMGVLFGGVTDEDTSEETLESVFHNDLYGYQITGNGRWISLNLRRPKKQGGSRNKPAKPVQKRDSSDDDDDEFVKVSGMSINSGNGNQNLRLHFKGSRNAPLAEVDPDDPNLTTPLVRYNAMLAVLRNTLYIYGGIFERGSKEYTLDDFHSLALDKLDKFICLKKSDVIIPTEGDEESSSDEDDGSDDSDDSDETEENEGDSEGKEEPSNVEGTTKVPEVAPVVEDPEDPTPVFKRDVDGENEARTKAQAYLGVSTADSKASVEDTMSTPLPGETLAQFYSRTKEYWSAKAFSVTEERGKELRRGGFSMAQERYAEYKPTLDQIEKILAEAGLDEEEMRRGAAAGPPSAQSTSRNRR